MIDCSATSLHDGHGRNALSSRRSPTRAEVPVRDTEHAAQNHGQVAAARVPPQSDASDRTVRPNSVLLAVHSVGPHVAALVRGSNHRDGGSAPPSIRSHSPCSRPSVVFAMLGGIRRLSAKPLLRDTFRGAGGNRTPVHQPVDELATTIPGVATDAVTPTGRLSARGGPRSVFPECQRSFSPSAVFPAVIPHFCCRAVMDWPRATFLLTMTLRSLDVNQAARANCSSAILVFAPFYESEQLGSQTRTALLTSKPVSPVIDIPM